MCHALSTAIIDIFSAPDPHDYATALYVFVSVRFPKSRCTAKDQGIKEVEPVHKQVYCKGT